MCFSRLRQWGWVEQLLAPDNQMPAPWCTFLTIPYPDPPLGDIDPQFAARAVAQNAARPVTRAEPLDQGLHRDRVHRGLPLRRRTPAARLVQRNGKLRQLGPN